MMLRKTYDMPYFKALDEASGEFEAIVSVFGNVDFQGDRVQPGAFVKSIKKWREKGDPIPVIWSHDWANPMAHIGWADPANVEEVLPGQKAAGMPGGLYVRGHIDVHKPFAAQVYDLMKERRVKEYSFAYDVNDEKKARDGANDLLDLDIIEVGPTLKGANPDTVTLGVKAQLEEAYKVDHEARVLQAAMEADPELAKALARKAAGSADDEESKAEKAPVPQSEGAMRTHLEEDHGITVDDDVEMEEMARIHMEDHDGGDANHEHEGMADDNADEKAASKPWHIEKRGDEYCVIKDDDGEVEGCHPTRDEAEAQMRALYASEKADEPDGMKAGRVIGAKAAAALKASLNEAVDAFIAEVNGASSAGDDSSEETKDEGAETKIDDELAALKARIDELTL